MLLLRSARTVSVRTWRMMSSLTDVRDQLALANDHLAKEDFGLAQGQLEAAHQLLDGASDGSVEEREDLQSEVLVNLAYAKQNLGRGEDALSLYEEALVVLRDAGDRGDARLRLCHALINYAEVLGHLERYEEAYEKSEEASKMAPDGVVKGAALSNMGSYMGFLSKFKESVVLQLQAVEIFDKWLGRENEYFVGALTNALRTLRDQEMMDEFDTLKARYSEVPIDLDFHTSPITPEMMEEATKSFEAGESRGSFDPPGFLVDAGIQEEDVQAFWDAWVKADYPKNEEFVRMMIKEMQRDDDEDGDDEGPMWDPNMTEEEHKAAIKEFEGGSTMLKVDTPRGIAEFKS